MNDEIRDYLIDIARRLEALANILSVSATLSSISSVNEPCHIKFMIDSIIRDELIATSGQIIDDIKE
ncbi:MAG: hypothetical protein K2J08_08060 [Ruminococcus sp.]|nr:hypothetical protein [Ruminococcus sp.]